MKNTLRQFVAHALAIVFLIGLAISVAATVSPVLGQTGFVHKPHKNPKLSMPLVLLSMNVKQATARPAIAEEVGPPVGFSKETLPKPLQDAIHAGQMRLTDKGEVQVYIEVNTISSDNLDELRSYGVTVQIVGEPKPDKSKGEVLTKVPAVQGLLPVTMINQVSALSFVRYIRLPDYGVTNTGSVDSQGDAILQAEAARSQFGVSGTGVRVGVISNGIGGIFATGCTTCGPTAQTPSPITLGDLPSATGTRNGSGVLTSVSGGITAQSFPSSSPNLEPPVASTEAASGFASEGTAMLEIVHDLAPGATLYFANAADGTSLSFQQAVNYLSANTDVSVDDMSFFIPPFDGTDAVSTNTATALNTDANPIRGYFTAVDNFAQDHYEGPFVDSGTNGTSITGEAGDLHTFQAVSGTTVDNNSFGASIADPAAIPASGTITVFLTWNDPANASSNDYDLFLVPLSCSGFSSTLPKPPCTISGARLAVSENPQTGTQPPIESLSYTNPSASSPLAVGIIIQNVNNAAAPRTFDMFVIGSLGDGSNPSHNFNTVSGSVPAEGDAGGSPVSVVSVGAIDQTQCTGPGTCTGSVETYSDNGPTEATPQATARMKPDVTATDDVTVTGAGGFGMNGPNGSSTGNCAVGETPCYFAGSSAAAPHVAAIAALTLQAAPCLLSSSNVNQPATSRTNLRSFITGTAVALPGISQSAPNNIEGFGLVNALAAITTALPKPNAGPPQTVNAASATGTTVSFSGSATDPDSCPVTLNWTGSCGTASGTTASLMCPVGNDTETLTASNGGVTASLPTSVVQVAVSDFDVATSPSTQTVNAGQSATYTITVAQQFGAFTNPVSLACSGLPSLTSCSFSQPSVTPGSSSATSTLTISTTAASFVLPMPSLEGPHAPLFAVWVGLLGVLIVAAILAKLSKRKVAFGFVFSAFLICLISPIVACSSPATGGTHSAGTQAGTYTVNVSGSSNQLQHSKSVTLVVQ